MIRARFAFLLALASWSLPGFAQEDLSAFEGIWQDFYNPRGYYSIHINETNDRMVLVDLSAIEKSGNTLKASYLGPIIPASGGIKDARLKVLDEDASFPTGAYIGINPASPTVVYISWGCNKGVELCLDSVQRIRKVF